MIRADKRPGGSHDRQFNKWGMEDLEMGCVEFCDEWKTRMGFFVIRGGQEGRASDQLCPEMSCYSLFAEGIALIDKNHIKLESICKDFTG